MKTSKKHQVRKKLVTGHGHPAMKRMLHTALIIATAPLTLPAATDVAVLVRAKLGKPVLFKQNRVGLDENSFQPLRFRSMLPETDSQRRTLSSDERLTGFGRHFNVINAPRLISAGAATEFGVQDTDHHSERCLR